MRVVYVEAQQVKALVAAIAALTGTEHENALVDILREASPFHPLLWDRARIEREMDEMREVAP